MEDRTKIAQTSMQFLSVSVDARASAMGDAMTAQARQWGARRLEQAMTLLMDTDLALRSAGQTAPQAALVERAFIRLSVMARR